MPQVTLRTIELLGGPADGFQQKIATRLPMFFFVGHASGDSFFRCKYALSVREHRGLRFYVYAGREKAKHNAPSR